VIELVFSVRDPGATETFPEGGRLPIAVAAAGRTAQLCADLRKHTVMGACRPA